MYDSTSSDEVGVWNLPNEVLALGDLLVRELRLSDRNETSARWMAHHLAELILEARDPANTKHTQSSAAAADLILKLWTYRDAIPGKAYPMKSWGQAFSLISLLDAQSSPFSRLSGSRTDQLLCRAFDGLRLLVAKGLVLSLGCPSEPVRVDPQAIKFMLEEERRMYAAINAWIEHFTDPHSRDPSAEDTESEQPGTLDEASIRHALEADIDVLIGGLVELKDQFRRDTAADPSDSD